MYEIIELLKGLLTPSIGVIAIYIAYQQYKTNRQRELRESRKAKFDVYRKVKKYITEVAHSGSITNAAHEEFNDAISEADFLFPEDIINWLEDLQCISFEWINQNKGISEYLSESGKSRKEFYSEQSDNSGYIKLVKDMESYIDQIQRAQLGLRERFSEYLEQK